MLVHNEGHVPLQIIGVERYINVRLSSNLKNFIWNRYPAVHPLCVCVFYLQWSGGSHARLVIVSHYPP